MDLQWRDGDNEARFSAHVEQLSDCLGHADRVSAFRSYCRGLPLVDAGYGNSSGFRDGLADLDVAFVVGVSWTATVWPPGLTPAVPAAPGRRPGGKPAGPRLGGRRGGARARPRRWSPASRRFGCVRPGRSSPRPAEAFAMPMHPSRARSNYSARSTPRPRGIHLARAPGASGHPASCRSRLSVSPARTLFVPRQALAFRM